MDGDPETFREVSSPERSRTDEDGPPGTSRSPLTGEPRERATIGAPNQHDLDAEDSGTDSARNYHGAGETDVAPRGT